MHRSNQGVVALEFLCVVWTWMLSLAFLLNIVLLLGNAVDLQAALNRAAMAASAQGCVSPDSINQTITLPTVLVNNVQLRSVQVRRSTTSGFNRDAALAAIGANNAVCRPTTSTGQGFDVVPQADYIFLDLEYDQHMFLFPSVHVRKTALAISSSLNLEGNG